MKDSTLRRRRMRRMLNHSVGFSNRDLLSKRNFSHGAFRTELTEHDSSEGQLYDIRNDRDFIEWMLGDNLDDLLMEVHLEAYLSTMVCLDDVVDDETFLKLHAIKRGITLV